MDAAAAIARELAELPHRDTASVRAVRRRWSKTFRGFPADEVLAIAMRLELEAGQTGKWVAYELIRFHLGAFADISPAVVEAFAASAASWYAVDALGTILGGPLWAKGRLPDAMIEDWSRSEGRWLRRSALVATVGAKADAGRTLAICRRLAADRDDMVEKALSWALRELAKRDRLAVELFMAEMARAVAPRVRREVRNKLTTGLKTPKPAGRDCAKVTEG